MNIDIDLANIIAKILSLLVAIVGHEVIHGYSAYKLGDNTAKALGRLSINPIKHIDPVGSIIVPGLLFITNAPFLFGWAKPVPINMHTVMKNGGESGAIKVSLAGVTFNFALVAIFSAIYLIIGDTALVNTFTQEASDPIRFLYLFVVYSIVINAVLGFFNLWPIPPLDGSQAIKYFAMKHKWYNLVVWINKLAPYGFFILIAIIATPLSKYLFAPIYWLISKLLS